MASGREVSTMHSWRSLTEYLLQARYVKAFPLMRNQSPAHLFELAHGCMNR